MKQLAFAFGAIPAPALDNFIPGRNAELLHQLRQLAANRAAERLIYVWGAPASGRTHLLKGAVGAARNGGLDALYFACGRDAPWPEGLGERDCIAVDDVERLDAAGQIALFNACNAVRERRGALIASGNVPPARLPLRADLVTRLGWGLVYEVHALSDEEKMQALRQRAADHGFPLGDDVLRYVMSRAPRDMATLLAVTDALDRHSLETKRAVTVTLARELLQSLPERVSGTEDR